MKNLISAAPLIYLITEGKTTALNFDAEKKRILHFIRIAVETKISLIQIREKQIPARLVFEIAAEAAKIAENTDTKILVNDRADIALAAGADGVHLTAASLSAEIVRQNSPEKFIVGVSTHTLEKAEIAAAQAADFVTFSPIFHSPNKGEPQGIERLAVVCERLKPFPVIALGGVAETNYREVLKAGAGGFAAIRFLNDEENLRKLAVENLKKK